MKKLIDFKGMTIDVGDNDFRCYPLDELDKVTLMKEVLDCETEIRNHQMSIKDYKEREKETDEFIFNTTKDFLVVESWLESKDYYFKYDFDDFTKEHMLIYEDFLEILERVKKGRKKGMIMTRIEYVVEYCQTQLKSIPKGKFRRLYENPFEYWGKLVDSVELN